VQDVLLMSLLVLAKDMNRQINKHVYAYIKVEIGLYMQEKVHNTC
jgi:hypothetical protein